MDNDRRSRCSALPSPPFEHRDRGLPRLVLFSFWLISINRIRTTAVATAFEEAEAWLLPEEHAEAAAEAVALATSVERDSESAWAIEFVLPQQEDLAMASAEALATAVAMAVAVALEEAQAVPDPVVWVLADAEAYALAVAVATDLATLVASDCASPPSQALDTAWATADEVEEAASSMVWELAWATEVADESWP